MLRNLVLCLLIFAMTLPGLANTPRAIVSGKTPPPGVTVLDRHGDLWLVTGDADALEALGGTILPPETENDQAKPSSRTFIPTPAAVIDDLVAQINGEDLISRVEWLVDLGVRVSNSPNLPVVADSLEARFTSFGLATEKHYFPMGTLSVPNVIATQTGLVHPDSVFVICAHFDATSEHPSTNTPGADDNGSGTIAVVTAARLLSAYQTDYTIKYVLFAGEEQGLVGSGYWASDMAAAGLPIVGALNFDMIAWWTSGVDFDLEIETNDSSLWLADAICYAADQYSDLPYQLHVNNSAWWGDHWSFWVNGYDAVNHEESYDWGDPDFNPNYHSTGDTPDQLDPAFFEGSVQTAVSALALLAGVTEISDVPEALVNPARLSASPNPFNGRVVFRLEADGLEGRQEVSIYDLRGRRVDEVAVSLSAGRGEITWDVRSTAGQSLPAGVYLARAGGLPGQPTCRVVYLP